MIVLIEKNRRAPLTIKIDKTLPHPVLVWMMPAAAASHLRKNRLPETDYQLTELTERLVYDLAAMLDCRHDEVRFCLVRTESLFSIAYRWLGGGMLAFFSFIPAYLFVRVVQSMIHDKPGFTWGGMLALALLGALFYFFVLLALRAFTGKGRKKDGGLLPPWAMKALIHAFGVMAVGIVAMGVYERDPRPIVGGILYVLLAHHALSRYQKSRRT